MIVVVDTNEAATNPKTIEQLRKHFSNVVLANICCDVQIPLSDGSVLAIERKAPSDFLASLNDGRLKQQVEAMHKIAKFVAVVITGRFEYGGNGFVKIEDEKTNWKSTSIRGMLRALQWSGTAVEFCPSSFYAQMIEELYTTCNNEDHRQGLQKHRVITFPPLDDRLQILGQFSGVGIESAQSLLQYAGVMENNADDEGYGSLAAALHWMTIMSQIDPNSRPKLWKGKSGSKKILSNRKLLGLASNEYLAIAVSKDDVKNDENETAAEIISEA